MKCLHWLWRWCNNGQNHSSRRRYTNMSANQKHIQKCAQLDRHRQFWGKPQCSRRRCNNEIVTVLIWGTHNFKDGWWWATFVHKPEYSSCRHIQWYIETNPYAKFRQISYRGYEEYAIARKIQDGTQQSYFSRPVTYLEDISKTRLYKYIENFQIKTLIFFIFLPKTDCGYSLDPQRGGSNEYPQSTFLSRNKKDNVYPFKPQFYYI